MYVNTLYMDSVGYVRIIYAFDDLLLKFAYDPIPKGEMIQFDEDMFLSIYIIYIPMFYVQYTTLPYMTHICIYTQLYVNELYIYLLHDM